MQRRQRAVLREGSRVMQTGRSEHECRKREYEQEGMSSLSCRRSPPLSPLLVLPAARAVSRQNFQLSNIASSSSQCLGYSRFVWRKGFVWVVSCLLFSCKAMQPWAGTGRHCLFCSAASLFRPAPRLFTTTSTLQRSKPSKPSPSRVLDLFIPI